MPHIFTKTTDNRRSDLMQSLFTQTTHGIKITVMPVFLADQSDPAEDFYVWAYSVTMENHGKETVKLLNRYWHITDAQGRVNEVRGPGVVGEHPILAVGESHRYTSGTHLTTPSGVMHGTYEFLRDDGTTFEATIPMFSLDSPTARERMN
jgi:ApaG protein